METAKTPDRTGGFVKLCRSDTTMELVLHDHKAFSMLAIIAIRAKWGNGLSVIGLNQGEAMIGDYKACGFTREEYRQACKRLKKYKLATFRATNKGTIAHISGVSVFDVCSTGNNHQNNKPTTIKQPSNNHQTTTNEEGEEGKDWKECKDTPLPPKGAILPFDSKAFKQAWQSFKEHRQAMRVKMTQKAEELALAKLPTDEATAIMWIENAIEKGWRGIYEPNKGGTYGGKEPRESEVDRRRREKRDKEYDDINEIAKQIPSTF